MIRLLQQFLIFFIIIRLNRKLIRFTSKYMKEFLFSFDIVVHLVLLVIYTFSTSMSI